MREPDLVSAKQREVISQADWDEYKLARDKWHQSSHRYPEKREKLLKVVQRLSAALRAKMLAADTGLIMETTKNIDATTQRTEAKVDSMSAQLQKVFGGNGQTATEIEQQIQALRLSSMAIKKTERVEKEATKLEVRFLKLLSVHADLSVKHASAIERKKPALLTKMTNTVTAAKTTLETIAAMDGLVGFEDKIASMQTQLAALDQVTGPAAGTEHAGDGNQGSSSSHAEPQEPCGKVCTRGEHRRKACVRAKGHAGQHRYEAFCGQSEGSH